MKIDCSKTVNFFKERGRMCEFFGSKCMECPMSSEKTGKEAFCSLFIRKYTEQAVEIVQKWSDEHPHKEEI